MPKVRSEFLTLEQVCSILKIKIKYAYEIYPTWIKWGVKAIRLNGSGRKLLFSKDEIYRMVEQWRNQ